MSSENKRSFFRLLFDRPLGAELKLIGLDGLNPETKIYRAALVDLSAGGGRFFTTSPLPNESVVLVELKFISLGKEFRTFGPIVRSVLPEPGHFEYCVQFSNDDMEISALTGMLNQLSIKLRRTSSVTGCSFLSDQDILDFPPLIAKTAR